MAASDPSDSLSNVARRLVAQPGAQTWIGLVVCVLREQDDEGRDVIVHRPAHFLAAAWRPIARGPTRWPECVAIGSPRAQNAISELLAQLPRDAKLFLADRDAVDASLAARILLASDRNLEAYQRAGIEAFLADEHRRIAHRIASDYRDRDAGFERFRARVLANPDDSTPRP
ncbi:MAG TPA: hypothetical protein VMV45_19885 [Casimicrobiaceae bacterium]|nr:hypothetical protein [Casimicrobiaceae bacterium]